MRIGMTLSCQKRPLLRKAWRPIYLMGLVSPRAVTTGSPILRSSIGSSPFAVRMRVPGRKQLGPLLGLGGLLGPLLGFGGLGGGGGLFLASAEDDTMAPPRAA